jgi:hypothetical protein
MNNKMVMVLMIWTMAVFAVSTVGKSWLLESWTFTKQRAGSHVLSAMK